MKRFLVWKPALVAALGVVKFAQGKVTTLAEYAK